MLPGSDTSDTVQARRPTRSFLRLGAAVAFAATVLVPSAATASSEAGSRSVKSAPAARPVAAPSESETAKQRLVLIAEVEKRLSDTTPVRSLAAPIPEPEPETTTTTTSEPETTTTTSEPEAPKVKAAAPASKPKPKPKPKPEEPSQGVWDQLAQCESGGDWSINTGNGYYGGLQFSQSSWQAVGGSGYPHQASRAEQIQMGERLKAQQGWGAWPACSSKLGLR